MSFLTEHAYIMTSLYIRGFGMGLIFTPLSSFALTSIKNDKMAQASGIMNTIRQIGGSMGVALLTTVLTARVNFHSQMYGGAIQASSQAFQGVTRNMAYFIQQHSGGSFTTAIKQGQSIIMSNIGTQAFIEGVNDDFLLAALISLLAFIPIILLKSKKKMPTALVGEHLEIMD
jgi:DHA2 family multidrug resistance protein